LAESNGRCLKFVAEREVEKLSVKKSETDWAEERREMVRLLAGYYRIHDERILRAMAEIPRHLFIPERFRPIADPYGDHPCPIGHGQTISQPYIVAYMTEKLNPQAGEKVLEIGAGSGYQSAVLAALGAEVYTIEAVPELAEHARRVLTEQGIANVQVRCGDGYAGWPEAAPFDVIIGTCAPEAVPPVLVEQLAEGGRMMLPVGEGFQRLVILRRRSGALLQEEDIAVRFVPMVHPPVA
jgi:protein-L-isoaspartate(D-aspartate) O-methyltransferase